MFNSLNIFLQSGCRVASFLALLVHALWTCSCTAKDEHLFNLLSNRVPGGFSITYILPRLKDCITKHRATVGKTFALRVCRFPCGGIYISSVGGGT